MTTRILALAVHAGELDCIPGLVSAIEADLTQGTMEAALASITADPSIHEWAAWEVERAGSRRVAAAALARVFVRAAMVAGLVNSGEGERVQEAA